MYTLDLHTVLRFVYGLNNTLQIFAVNRSVSEIMTFMFLLKWNQKPERIPFPCNVFICDFTHMTHVC
jgi:hypothetical protein